MHCSRILRTGIPSSGLTDCSLRSSNLRPLISHIKPPTSHLKASISTAIHPPQHNICSGILSCSRHNRLNTNKHCSRSPPTTSTTRQFSCSAILLKKPTTKNPHKPTSKHSTKSGANPTDEPPSPSAQHALPLPKQAPEQIPYTPAYRGPFGIYQALASLYTAYKESIDFKLLSSERIVSEVSPQYKSSIVNLAAIRERMAETRRRNIIEIGEGATRDVEFSVEWNALKRDAWRVVRKYQVKVALGVAVGVALWEVAGLMDGGWFGDGV